MKRRSACILSLTFLVVATLAAPAAADTRSLSASCEFRGGIDCTTACSNLNFEASCDGELAASCSQTQCVATADVSCYGSCEGTCEGKCTADPGNFKCGGTCTADCSAECEGQCNASTHGATSQADCVGKCKASCNATCDAHCTGDAPQVDCHTRCQGSCEGRCTAKANMSCQIDCQAKGYVNCTANASGGCQTNCQTHGGLIVCDGVVQAFVSAYEEAEAWIRQHVVVTASGGSSCSNGTCEAHGQVHAEAKCSAAPFAGQRRTAGALAGGLGAFGLALAVGVARRRRK